MNKNIVNKIMVLIILAIVLVGVGMTFPNWNVKSLPDNLTDNNDAFVPSTSLEQQDLLKSQAKSLFSTWIVAQGNLTDWNIDSIDFVAAKNDPTVNQTWFPETATIDAFMVSVNFNVKQISIDGPIGSVGTPDWRTGNGVADEKTGWVNHNSLILQIDKINGVYQIVGAGTGI